MTVWWSTEKISATISQDFIERELGTLKNREALHRVLQFGDGLTDNTYLDWALERSPRFFLILNDLGCPQKIFDVIDRSHDDDDLPLSQDTLWELNLFGTKSETLDKKFHRVQYNYLIQDLDPGGHVDYGPLDIVPLDPVVKKTQMSDVQATERVYAYDRLYTRKRVPLLGEDAIDRIQFILHLRGIASIRHPHVVSVFATYSYDNFNFVLLTPSTDLSLKQILNDDSKQFKLLEKVDRRELVMTWTHCITSALAYLHEHGFDHKNIRPSTILVDQNSKVFLGEYGAQTALDGNDSTMTYKAEQYEHSPPENWLRKPCLHETAPLKSTLPGGGRTSRRLPKKAREPVVEGKRRASTPGVPPSPSINTGITRSNSKSASSSGSSSHPRPRNAYITTFVPKTTSSSSIIKEQYPADIFSLSTVLLSMLTYLVGYSPKQFASHRSKFNRQAGRGNAPPDASFHKNLGQVETWMDKLVKEAGQKEKKDVKFWGAVVELVGVCRQGLSKEPHRRVDAAGLEKKVDGWVDWGLARRRRCTCYDQEKDTEKAEKEEAKEVKPRHRVRSPKRHSERISYIDQLPERYWTTPSEDVSEGMTTQRNSYATWSSGPPRRESSATERRRDSVVKDTSLASPTRTGSLPTVRNLPGSGSLTSDTYTNGSMSVQGESRTSLSRPVTTFTRNTTQSTLQTEVWGLEGALEESEEYDEFDVRTELAETEYDEDDETDTVSEAPMKKAWPLPPVSKDQFIFNDPRIKTITSTVSSVRSPKPRKESLTNYERLERDMMKQHGLGMRTKVA